ncbi:hypothetical protein BDY21DRAFT_418252 [Lineolata rhizophorae]|uniref:Zn(2)-C6 fungal-type domain-containing protein n=1 Tax=Lineolata rhizophorae TaxID=578093 RepID=A0A6A6PG54_9PEZI|nr:hypothetical protein BDY21DRAFT_418252 [Lineolata rhizophorae]
MVGVPGRSKGCHTCRKRRVKCDETKPTCKRCEKSGYWCAGYERELQFVHSSTSPLPSSSRSTSGDAQAAPQTSVVPIRGGRRPPPPPAVPCSVPDELSLEAFQGDVCLAFLFENFVWRSYGTPWLELAAKGKLDALSSQACQALARSNFGRAFHDAELQTSGAVEYGAALQALRPMLSDPSRPDFTSLVVPVLILLMHSGLHEDRDGSAYHVRGLFTLLSVCGPEAFQEQPLRSAFESCRSALIVSGLLTRRRTFFEDDRWKDVPWANDPWNKSQQNHLADILSHVPGFLDDEARLSQEPSEEARANLLAGIRLQLSKLFRWRYAWEMANPCAVWEAPADRFGQHANLDRRVVQTTLHFAIPIHAAEIALYDAVQLWLLGLLWKTDPHGAAAAVASLARGAASAVEDTSSEEAQSGETRSPLYLPGETVMLRDVALEICRAFEYHIKQHAKVFKEQLLFYLMPIGLAWSVLEKEDRAHEWIADILATSQFTQGYATGNNSFGFRYYLREMGFPRYEQE